MALIRCVMVTECADGAGKSAGLLAASVMTATQESIVSSLTLVYSSHVLMALLVLSSLKAIRMFPMSAYVLLATQVSHDTFSD